ncbi:DUF6274 family protein [Streptomyces sp. NPDC015492]|uniref:DUF6274 family protein n=1 Tax=Streptomyces sp. NPDC015492 TaxID=3364958 RepID=UPI0036F52824
MRAFVVSRCLTKPGARRYPGHQGIGGPHRRWSRMAAASAARHETRALLRAHLAAASRYGHLTRHCVVCHRLLRLAMDLPEPEGPQDGRDAPEGPEGAERPEGLAEPGEPPAGPGRTAGEPGEPAERPAGHGRPAGDTGGPVGDGGDEGPADP